MNDHTIKASRRQLRKLVGSDAARLTVDTAFDFQMFRRRGLWGRLKWLFFGR